MKIAITSCKDGEWRQWFAWHPVAMGGFIVWLERIERRWNADSNFRVIHAYDCGEYAGSWEYRFAA